MAKDIDLTSKEWLNFVFEGRNKSYGSYELREDSSNRHIGALVVVIFMLLGLVYIPNLVKSFIPDKPDKVLIQTDDLRLSAIVEQTSVVEKPVLSLPVAPQPQIARAIKFTEPVIVSRDEVPVDELMSTQAALSDNTAVISIMNVEQGIVNGGVDPADVAAIESIQEPTQAIYQWVEVPPTFPGGSKEMNKWLSENISYPVIAAENGVEGRVILGFVVGPDGSVTDVEIIRSLDPACDKEAIRVVKQMPKWIPGKQNGHPVYVYYTLPVLFKLRN